MRFLRFCEGFWAVQAGLSYKEAGRMRSGVAIVLFCVILHKEVEGGKVSGSEFRVASEKVADLK